MHQRVLDQVRHHLLEPPGVAHHPEVARHAHLDLGGVAHRRQRDLDGGRQVDRAGGEEERPRLELAHVVQVVGQARDALGLVTHRRAHALDALGRQLRRVALEGDAEAQDGRQRVAQVVGDEGEELVLGLLELVGRGHVPHHARVADDRAFLVARHRADVENAAYAVGPRHRQLDPPVVGVGRLQQALDHARPLRAEHIVELGLVDLVEGTSEDDRQRRVGVLQAAVAVDFVDAVRRVLDDVLVPGPRLLLATDDRGPVSLGDGISEPVHGRQDPREEQRQGKAPVAAAFLGQLDRGLHDEVAGDAEDHQQLRQGRARPRRAGAHVLQIADEGLVHLLALAGDREDGLEPLAGLVDEPGLLRQRPSRRLGEHGGEDVERPPGHLLAAAVEGVEQGLGIGRLGRLREHVAGPVIGIAGEERLQVAEGEAKAGAAAVGRREVAGADQRLHTLYGKVEKLRRLAQVEARLPQAITHVVP